jgi:hypothetical protein
MKGKDTDKRILKLLYRSLDSDLDDKDQKKLDNALEGSEELRQEKERILVQRQVLVKNASQSFGPFFADRVMNRIERLSPKKNGLEAFYESFMAAFRKVAIVSVVVLVILVSYNLIKSDIVPEDELFFMADTTIEEILDLPLF